MEYSLTLPELLKIRIQIFVLILILMEYSLTTESGYSNDGVTVLILILMEYSLTLTKILRLRGTTVSLNPYSNGILSDK